MALLLYKEQSRKKAKGGGGTHDSLEEPGRTT